MKKIIITLIVGLGFVYSMQAQTRLYENPNFDVIAADHQLIAILPFKTTVKLRPKQMESMSKKQFDDMQAFESKNVQMSLYSWFLKRSSKGKLIVKIKSPQEVNSILLESGITMSNINDKRPTELARLLGVDAVVMGDFSTNKPMSEGASLALGVLFGVWGTTNEAMMNLFIYNGEDGEVLVNYTKYVAGSLGSSTDNLINIIMRKASRRIAYTK